MTANDLDVLIERARKVEMTAVELEEQRRSFAFGNAHIENSDVTRETINEAAEELKRSGDSAKRE